MNKIKILKIISLLLLVLAIFYVYNIAENVNVNNKKIIKIGAVLPLTGDVAAYGIDSKNGIDLAVKLANKSQDKYRFEVIYRDSKGKPSVAVNALQQLISVAKPTSVIGENISSSTGAMIPIIDKNKILLLSPSASAPSLSGLSKYFFRVFPSDDEEGAFISNVVANQHENGRVSIIYVNNDYGIGLKDVFKKEAKKNNLTILNTLAFNKTQKDFRTIILKIRNDPPDAIYIPSYYENGALLVKQIREQGISVDIYGSTTHEDPKFIEIAGNFAEGFQYPISTGYNANDKNPTIINFISDFNKIHHKNPGLVTALGYDCAKIIIDATINKGNSSDKIREYILETKNIKGVAGIMNFDEEGNVHKPIILKIIKGGKFVSK